MFYDILCIMHMLEISITVFSYDACIQETNVVLSMISRSSDIEFAVTPMGACFVRAAYLRDLCHTSASSRDLVD